MRMRRLTCAVKDPKAPASRALLDHHHAAAQASKGRNRKGTNGKARHKTGPSRIHCSERSELPLGRGTHHAELIVDVGITGDSELTARSNRLRESPDDRSRPNQDRRKDTRHRGSSYPSPIPCPHRCVQPILVSDSEPCRMIHFRGNHSRRRRSERWRRSCPRPDHRYRRTASCQPQSQCEHGPYPTSSHQTLHDCGFNVRQAAKMYQLPDQSNHGCCSSPKLA